MSSPIDWTGLTGYKDAEDSTVTIEATVPTGFESAAKTEALGMFGFEDKDKVVTHQGRILFDLPLEKAGEVQRLED